jgi:hypothetical protein
LYNRPKQFDPVLFWHLDDSFYAPMLVTQKCRRSTELVGN